MKEESVIMKIKYNIAFKLRPYGVDKNLFQIRIRATFNGERIDMATGCKINDKSSWDEKEQLVVSGYRGPNGNSDRTINTVLRSERDRMEMAFQYFEVNDVMPSASQVVEKYQGKVQGEERQQPGQEEKKTKKVSAPTLFQVFDEFVKESGEKNAWSDTTFQKMASLKEDLLTFNAKLKFEGIVDKELTRFVQYLRDTKKLHTPRKKKGDREDYDEEDLVGLKNSTIEKKLAYLRWFLNWATIKGYNTNLAYKTYRPTLKKTQKKVIYLNEDELRQLNGFVIPAEKSYLECVRDVFLFCCFSGLRHSDVYNLRRSDIDIKANQIVVTTVKTNDNLNIELNDVTRLILKKYEGVQFPDDKALPVIKNQSMNRDLKELCRLAGIDEKIRITSFKGNVRKEEVLPKWQLVGTHTGRKTFIVTALSNGTTPDTVMKWTGHSDYKSMKPYIDIVDSVKANEMKKFNSIL